MPLLGHRRPWDLKRRFWVQSGCADLDDGRVYSITVATPNNIYWCMENEGLDYFFGCPPLFVRRLTQENVERAIKALIEDEQFLPVYGVLQQTNG